MELKVIILIGKWYIYIYILVLSDGFLASILNLKGKAEHLSGLFIICDRKLFAGSLKFRIHFVAYFICQESRMMISFPFVDRFQV